MKDKINDKIIPLWFVLGMAMSFLGGILLGMNIMGILI